ncbi:acyl-CoA N-acyltransferase [Phlebopus sp. FC_14]|nr:acyl-CoA N-acyltransferase [Phlebopus sp. FC_14]
MAICIRPATKLDEPALASICLRSADAGKSAELLHNFPDLPGEVYALPYVNIASTWAFVLVDQSAPESEKLVGYVVGAFDTREFEKDAAINWWPVYQAKYAKLLCGASESRATEPDMKYIDLIMSFPPASDAQIAFSPAHLHINILEEYQRKGHGRELIGHAIRHLKEQGVRGVWLGMNPRNVDAAAFYARLGFHPFEGSPDAVVGITCQEWEERMMGCVN